MPRYFAIVTRGLEEVARDDCVRAVPGIAVRSTEYRRIVFEHAGSAARLLGLRAVDDVFAYAGEYDGLVPQRAALAGLRAWLTQSDWMPALATCATVRRLGDPPRVSVSASFVGRRNYTTHELKAEVAAALAARYGWAAADDDEADLSARVFAEGARALFGLRLGAHPLHRRSYKRASLPGSLKAPVAWAMLRLAGAEPGQTVMDPLCGAGTIAIEAAVLGARALGGDAQAPALEASRENARAARVRVEWIRWDAARLPVATGSIQRIVCNLPFGKQSPLDQSLYGAVLAEFARVLAYGGRAALLTTQATDLAAALAHRAELAISRQIEISLFGQNPRITLVERW